MDIFLFHLLIWEEKNECGENFFSSFKPVVKKKYRHEKRPVVGRGPAASFTIAERESASLSDLFLASVFSQQFPIWHCFYFFYQRQGISLFQLSSSFNYSVYNYILLLSTCWGGSGKSSNCLKKEVLAETLLDLADT